MGLPALPNGYDLIFVIAYQDFFVPLVLSQTFDQAQAQTTNKEGWAPTRVSVWVLTPMRYVVTKALRRQLSEVRLRCPDVRIRILPGIDRFNDFPRPWIQELFRRGGGGGRDCVYHFRGEGALLQFARSRRRKPRERYVLDVRGYWPAELLYQQDVFSPELATGDLRIRHDEALRRLCAAAALADGLAAVSANLADLVREVTGIADEIPVVPCCVKALVVPDPGKRLEIRNRLGVKPGEFLAVYSGGYARYQHLEDLTIPFLDLLMEQDDRIRVVMLSHRMDRMQEIVGKTAVHAEKFLYASAPQSEVAEFLTACDLGVLLRKESLVNRVAQPVKVGEYLASGVPICVEGEVGGVTGLLTEFGAGLSIRIDEQPEEVRRREAARVRDFLTRETSASDQALRLADAHFTWERAVPRQRALYARIFGKSSELRH